MPTLENRIEWQREDISRAASSLCVEFGVRRGEALDTLQSLGMRQPVDDYCREASALHLAISHPWLFAKAVEQFNASAVKQWETRNNES